MNLYLRFIALMIRRFFSARSQRITEPCNSAFRVRLLDLDFNLHMNNGRYFSVMDLGRFDLMLRAGQFYRLFRSGYYPVVLSESIVFQKSLTYRQRYEVRSSLTAWDEKFIYMTQEFISADATVASANVRFCFKRRGHRGIVPVDEIFALVGEEYTGASITELAQRQIALDQELAPRP
jgi:acyl-CoA thioesterase FadM